jgi:PIN domain nuclease of toxin-antitoxin system
MVVFDTCVFLKYLFGEVSLSSKNIVDIKQLIKSKNICASTSTLWEIECFSAKKISQFGVGKQQIINTITQFNTHFYAIDPVIIQHAYALKEFHNDPADRFIVATALVHKKELWTSDKKIISWAKNVPNFKLKII